MFLKAPDAEGGGGVFGVGQRRPMRLGLAQACPLPFVRTMTHAFADACLAALANTTDEEEWSRLLRQQAKRLVATPDVVAAIARTVAGAAESERAEDASALLSAVLNEARMAQENGLRHGGAVLAAIDDVLVQLDQEGALTAVERMRFARIYARSELQPPKTAMLTDDIIASPRLYPDATSIHPAPDIDALLEEVLNSVEDDPLQVHMALNELFAAMPMDLRAHVVAAVAARSGDLESRLVRYWLLDRAPEIRLAAAMGLLNQARRGHIAGDVAASLARVRKWLPEEPSRGVLDEAIKAVLRQGGAAPPSNPWTVQRVLTSLPDGAGAQSIAAAVRRGKRRGVALFLLKQGHGVKDAFIVDTANATQQKQLLARVTAGTDAFEVTPDFAPQTLSRALGDGAAHNAPIAPGVVDAAEVWGEDLIPVASDAQTILSSIGADAALAEIPARTRVALVLESGDWPEKFALFDTWFEDTTEVRDICARSRSERGREAALWTYLETRRDWWARQIAVGAATLKAQLSGDLHLWLSLAATAQALIAGRALKKTPIMTQIVRMTMEADWTRREYGDGFYDAHASSPLATVGVKPSPEVPGEMARLLSQSWISEAWLDGYLAALAISPDVPTPTKWLGPLLGGIELKGADSVPRALDLIMLRSNRVNDEAADPATVAEWLARYDAAAFKDWANGFSALVAAAKSAWPARLLATDDKRIMKALAMARKGAELSDVRALLPAWISRRHALRQ